MNSIKLITKTLPPVPVKNVAIKVKKVVLATTHLAEITTKCGNTD